MFKNQTKKYMKKTTMLVLCSILVVASITAQFFVAFERGHFVLGYTLIHFGIFLVFLAGLFAVLFRYFRDKERQKYEVKLDHLSSNLENMEQQLIRAAKLATLGELAAGVAHEVMNPLSSISSYCQLIQRKKENLSEEQIRDYAQKISGEIFRVSRILNDIRDYSTVCPTDSVEDINPDEIVDETLEMLKLDPRFKQVQIEKKRKAQSLCRVSAEKIKQVLLNIFINAADAMPGGGVLRLLSSSTMHKGQKFYQIEVYDTGCGIEELTQKRIFEPFFTTKQDGKGTGLGLSVSKRIMESYKGGISFRSQPGSGSVFILRLPVLSVPQIKSIKPA
ncbi:MAG: hypothetical protein HYS98_01450 [Deltaproteobacteria bacterium]|nr:hypothetical protein [Deltaproteobacteria bacterium]